MDPTAQGIHVAMTGPLCEITLNRPDSRNALTVEDRWSLASALEQADADPDCRIVVITGAGDHFCSGGDINEFAVRKDLAAAEDYVRSTAQAVFCALRAMRTPTLARVKGVAAGAGMFLALGCDITIADESAIFYAAHLNLGVVPDWGAVWLMPRLVGMARAKALLLTAGRITATEAQSWGLIAECVPKGDLDDRVRWFTHTIGSLPPEPVGLTRQGLDRSADMSMPEFLDWEAVANATLTSGDEHAARVAAFLSRKV